MRTNCRWHVGVVIPARNEEELLPRCLRSILAAKAHLGNTATTDIVVVADGSVDRTMQIASRMLRSHGTVLKTETGVVGAARAAGAALLLEKYKGLRERCWIANTDADCIVPPDWLARQLQIASKGTEAIAGTVTIDSFAEHGPEVPARFSATYLISADGSHPHVHGANLGVRADVYLLAGGWRNLTTGEDHDLWGRLTRIGAAKKSTCQLEIKTSGRRVGRAPHGFAGALAAHNETAA